MRLFFGIPLEDKVKADIFEFLEKKGVLRKNYKWVKRDNLHITLKFLGEVKEHLLSALYDTGKKTAENFSEFQAFTQGFSGFPAPQRARVFFLEVKPEEKIEKLFIFLERELEKLGFEKERRKYHPHITLARIKGFVAIPELPYLKIQFKINEFCLYKSDLRKEGAVYTVLKTFSLKGVS